MKAVKNQDPLQVSRRLARWVVAVAAILPLLLILMHDLTNTMGPVMHPLGDPSPYLLDFWNVLSVVAAMLLVIPGGFMAYKLRGFLGASTLLAWMMAIAYVAYFVGRWIQ
ncbi:MAG TPA: hypothetical protein VIE43_02700 [Thermoanaerobaculia bacterium]|nr:hypothetical protein [Thermoanaerobaculia bacterium]